MKLTFHLTIRNPVKEKIILFVVCVISVPVALFSQKHKGLRADFEDSTLQNTILRTIMPYNRILQPAGKIVTYGNPSFEDHALDLCTLPDKKFMAIENRYGIAILNIESEAIVEKWSYNGHAEWKNNMSTYSGITAFTFNDKVFITWGSGTRDSEKSALMIAQWNGKNIVDVSSVNIKKTSPADLALPNQVIANTEDGTLYLYVVLNGNDQLMKLRFSDKKIIWTASTGVAPYGLCIIRDKAYVTNWAGPQVTDTAKENAGTPWGRAYTNPVTGATQQGSLSVIDIHTGAFIKEIPMGLHPNAIIKSSDEHFLYIANSNSDMVSVVNVDKEEVADFINVGLFSKGIPFYGSSPNALALNQAGNILYVANGMDNAVAVIKLGKLTASSGKGSTIVKGYIPTEAYPSGIQLINKQLYVTNLEAKGARVLSDAKEIIKKAGAQKEAYTIHKQLASLSIINLPGRATLNRYTATAKQSALFYRIALTNSLPRENVLPKPLPERIGEPSVFRHVVYIIKENKTYDQVFGDIVNGRGDKDLCIYGDSITPNQHKLSSAFSLLDNYYASGKSSAEGHQWTDAAMVSDYIERNVRAWFRSYPHRQADALVYNKNGFIWNDALDHGKKVRVYGEACLTHYDTKMKWLNIYKKYIAGDTIARTNTSTIARIRPIISPDYPDCDNINFTDQLRADVFIKEWKNFEQQQGDCLPNLIVLSLPDDHTAGTSPDHPVPRAMVADNDLALGRIIETIAHSRFWDSTVVFVTEDDSQSGWDHISSYRTTCLVISPYSMLNKTIHTNYNQTSMVRTIEQILGIPPMNVIDATALPMFDCFNDKKQSCDFHFMPARVPLNEMNSPLAALKGKAKYYAKMSSASAFKEVDGGQDDMMNRILWFDAKGNSKYPGAK